MYTPYKSCPDCGANLDPGERCDCSQDSINDQEKKGTQSNEK